MVAKNNAVFRFLLEIKDFVNKGRKVIQINNQIAGSTQKASNSMDKLQDSTKKTGDTMAANAVNFQTATQGMLNLTTAGVQTFTSFSNLDRAGNRLAQAQIGVSRATDLLNNKQLRLNELIAKGQGNSQKAVLLTNELATARADLLVKTDKLKIEEGALLDIQLLFVTNIANVMISSMQTVISLKNAHIGSTIKQIVQERLLATTLFTKTTPAFTAATGSISAYNTAAKTTINTNRLLMIGIPGIGAALVAASVAVEAYNDNWGGFRDMVQSVLPFMRDQKKLLADVKDEMNGTALSADELTNSFDNQLDVLFKLPDKYVLAKQTIENLSKAYGVASKEAKEFNKEVAKNPQSFRVATQQGGFLPTLHEDVQVSGSNVIRVEGDAVNTAKSIRSSSISRPATNDLLRMASSGVLPSAYATSTETIQQIHEPIITNTAGGIYRQNSIYDLINIFDPTTQAGTGVRNELSNMKNELTKDIGVINQHMSSIATNFNEWAERNKIDLRMPTSFGEFITKLGTGIGRDYDATRAEIIGIDPEIEKQILQSREMIKKQLESGTSIPFGTLTNVFTPKPQAGKFVGGGAFFPGLEAGGFGGTKQLQAAIKIRDDLIQQRRTQIAGSKRYVEINNLLSKLDEGILKATTDPNVAAQILLHDKLTREIGLEQFIVDPDDPEAFKKFTESSAKKREQAEIKNLMKIIDADIKQQTMDVLAKDAAAVGLSIDELVFRRRIGGAGGMGGLTSGISGIGKDILVFGHEITSDQLSFLEKYGKVSSFSDSSGKIKYKYEPVKVKQAKEIRKRLEAGIFYNMGLPTDTLHDKLILRSFGRVGGITLSSDDPLLRDISGFGERRAEIYSQRMIDPITGEDMGAMGIDIGRIADTITLEEGKRLAKLQKELKEFRGIGGRADATISTLVKASSNYKRMQVEHAMGGMEFGAGFFKSAGATAAYQVPRGSVRASQAFYDRIRIRDENTNRLRWGGKLREGMSIEDEGAVVGGYSSAKEFSRAGKRKQFEAWDQAQLFADWFSGIGRVSSYTGKSDLRGQLNGIKQRADTIKNALSSAGLGYKRFNARTGLRYRYTMAEYNRFHKEWAEVRAFNDNQYAKAREINLLQEGFGLTGFTGSALTLPSLQQEVARQDELMRTIGLDRTEAFQIVDTEGRGREEIDDRIRFKDRMNSMSTGVSVL